jgi:hypothetical protein
MPIYFVERYLPGRDRAWLEAASVADVRDANKVAGVPFAGIVAVAEIGVDERGPTHEGGSS